MKARDVTKAQIWCLDKSAWNLELQFNPEAGSMELSRTVRWDGAGGGYDPWGGPLDYDQGEPDTLQFAVLFDQSTVGEPDLADAAGLEKALLAAIASLFPEENEDSVLPDLQKLYRLTCPIEPAKTSKGSYDVRPPIVAFVWEEFEFMGALTSVTVEFLLMDHKGRPRRARAACTMTGRAFTGSVDLEGFINAKYTPPKGATSARSGTARDDVLKLLK